MSEGGAAQQSAQVRPVSVSGSSRHYITRIAPINPGGSVGRSDKHVNTVAVSAIVDCYSSTSSYVRPGVELTLAALAKKLPSATLLCGRVGANWHITVATAAELFAGNKICGRPMFLNLGAFLRRTGVQINTF